MVVDAQGVVAAADEPIDEDVGEIVVRVVGRIAEVHAVEALLHAGQALELEVAADGLEPAVLASGSVLEAHAGEVESGAGGDVLAVVKGHPAVAREDFNLPPLREGKRLAGRVGEDDVPDGAVAW